MNRYKHEVRAEIKVGLTSEDIDHIMGTAMDGGITPWCARAEVVGSYLGDSASDQISRGGTLVLHAAESSDKWELTLDKLLTGVKLYMESGEGFCVEDEMLNTYGIDEDVSDQIIQYALFGKLMFGIT